MYGVCPGYVATDMTQAAFGGGGISPSQGADTPVWLALQPSGSIPVGQLFAERCLGDAATHQAHVSPCVMLEAMGEVGGDNMSKHVIWRGQSASHQAYPMCQEEQREKIDRGQQAGTREHLTLQLILGFIEGEY